jgi:hypothetical protein
MVSVDVLSTDVRSRAGVLAELFERDCELAVQLNAARLRLLVANERLTVVLPVGVVLVALTGSAGADLGVTGRPAVLDAEFPVTALGEVADTIRCALIDYQSVGERRRMLAADIGEATVRLVDALVAAGFSESQARRADVRALRDGVYREG